MTNHITVNCSNLSEDVLKLNLELEVLEIDEVLCLI
mgnify:CR=1 FL=1